MEMGFQVQQRTKYQSERSEKVAQKQHQQNRSPQTKQEPQEQSQQTMHVESCDQFRKTLRKMGFQTQQRTKYQPEKHEKIAQEQCQQDSQTKQESQEQSQQNKYVEMIAQQSTTQHMESPAECKQTQEDTAFKEVKAKDIPESLLSNKSAAEQSTADRKD